MDDTKKLIQESADMYIEIIKEQAKQRKIPAVILFIDEAGLVYPIHSEVMDANMLKSFLQTANQYADMLEDGTMPIQHFPKDFKSK